MNTLFQNALTNCHLAIKTVNYRITPTVSSTLEIAKFFFSKAYMLAPEYRHNAKNNWGLHSRAWEGCPVDDLLGNGADINARDGEEQTPLFQTAWNGRPWMTLKLLTNGADVNAEDQQGIQAIHAAAVRGHTKILKILIKQGANTTATNHLGQTPLSWAAYKGHENSINYLLKNCADLFSKDKKGKNALHSAAEGGKTDVCIMLNKKGISWNAVDSFGNTPLHYAYLYGHMSLINKLIEAGADRNIENQASHKPEDLLGLGGLNSRIRICWYNIKNIFTL